MHENLLVKQGLKSLALTMYNCLVIKSLYISMYYNGVFKGNAYNSIIIVLSYLFLH